MANAGESQREATTRLQARPREVVVNGNRVRVVDMHAHCSVPEATALMGVESGWSALLLANYRRRLDDMDQQGIDVEALSINPYWYEADRDLAGEVVRIQNEKLAEFCASEPRRFVGFASVALQHPDLAAQQLEDGVKRYNLRGALIGGSVAGETPGSTPSGRRPRNSARSSSFTRRGLPS